MTRTQLQVSQEVPMTREEKIAMYMSIDKRLLAEMLVEANDVIDIVAVNRDIGVSRCMHNYIQKDATWKSCTHCGAVAPLFDNK